MVVCTTLVGGYEGCDTVAKYDMIGTGHPLTWCHGETIGNVKPGQHFTKKECDDALAARLPEYWDGIKDHIKVETSDNEKIAYTSFSYNVGVGAFNHSGLLKKLNAGDHKGACDGLMAYTHASGKVVQGLVNRRAAERKICLSQEADEDKKQLVSNEPLPRGELAPKHKVAICNTAGRYQAMAEGDKSGLGTGHACSHVVVKKPKQVCEDHWYGKVCK